MKYTLAFTLFFFAAITGKAQKTFSDGTLVYNISVETGSAETQMADMFDGATSTVYLKGAQSRSEMVSGLGNEVTILDSKTGKGIILKDYSGQKLMITMTKEDWEKKNRKFEGITFELTGETMVIAGYTCKKAVAKLQDGSSFIVYYTTELNPINKDYDYQFKKLPGLAMQYELIAGKMKFRYTLSKINFDNVAASKFDIPKSGYRILTFEETQNRR
ncbi:hypothetical protein BH09BAC2_BH09BAC2_17930 [soil metagenome]